ncbi:MAG: hypothetical protein GC159_17260 [Phycisphaera sp.]|nr:hypothetical protein [Phycisphaera sp.]
MTRTLTIVALSITLGLLSGCIPSLHTIYSKDVAAYDENLIGVWAEKPGAKETWRFDKVRFFKRYSLTYADKEGVGEFDARLVKLGDTLFLDLYPDKVEHKDRPDIYNAHLLGVHTIMRVILDGQELELLTLDRKWLKKHLADAPTSLKHELIDGDDDKILITASTAELQKFYQDQADNTEAWAKPIKLQLIEKTK